MPLKKLIKYTKKDTSVPTPLLLLPSGSCSTASVCVCQLFSKKKPVHVQISYVTRV